VIGSPSLWWGHDVIFDLEQEYADAHGDLAARVFMGIGSHEDQAGREREAGRLSDAEQAIPASRYIDMAHDVRRTADALRARSYPSLRLDTEVFADEFHITVPFLTLSRGLRVLFDALQFGGVDGGSAAWASISSQTSPRTRSALTATGQPA
jgi:predicted alpha/beta superfamily hydrolase